MYAEVAIAFIFACITSYILVPRFIKVAHKVGAIDVPKDNRRMHKRPIPKFGGPAVICGFLVASIYLFIVATVKKQINLFGDEQRYDKSINGAVISNGKIHGEVVDTIKKYLKGGVSFE